ncbi:C40 family peptidase [Clostridium sp.]|uniref:C40 family peptidase n=2 Tax=unclassified Clostridium TaxID=2614128 RepID=UPI003216CA3C
MKSKIKFFRLLSIVMATFLIFQAFPAKKVFATTIADQVIAEAEKYMGVPYVWGGKTPSGFDCSGFVWYVFKQFGYTLEPPTTTQVKYGTNVSFSNLKKGDLIFFDDTYDGPNPTHVGIYAGNGEMIHASDTKGITRANINTSYWKDHFATGRRILSDVPEPGTPDTLIGAVDIYADSEAKVKIGTLNAGTNVKVEAYYSKLTSIYYNDTHVYIATSALKSKAKSVKFEESKPIYGDSNFSKVIDNLTAGSSFYISDEYSDSYRIYYQNSFAYVKKDKGTPDTLIGAVDIYADSEAKVKIGTLNVGTNVRVEAYYSKLTSIYYNDTHVYIATSALKSKAKSVTFKENKPIYGDSNFSKVIDNLTAGSSFYITDEYSDSYRIYYKNSFAYVKK